MRTNQSTLLSQANLLTYLREKEKEITKALDQPITNWQEFKKALEMAELDIHVAAVRRRVLGRFNIEEFRHYLRAELTKEKTPVQNNTHSLDVELIEKCPANDIINAFYQDLANQSSLNADWSSKTYLYSIEDICSPAVDVVLKKIFEKNKKSLSSELPEELMRNLPSSMCEYVFRKLFEKYNCLRSIKYPYLCDTTIEPLNLNFVWKMILDTQLNEKVMLSLSSQLEELTNNIVRSGWGNVYVFLVLKKWMNSEKNKPNDQLSYDPDNSNNTDLITTEFVDFLIHSCDKNLDEARSLFGLIFKKTYEDQRILSFILNENISDDIKIKKLEWFEKILNNPDSFLTFLLNFVHEESLYSRDFSCSKSVENIKKLKCIIFKKIGQEPFYVSLKKLEDRSFGALDLYPKIMTALILIFQDTPPHLEVLHYIFSFKNNENLSLFREFFYQIEKFSDDVKDSIFSNTPVFDGCNQFFSSIFSSRLKSLKDDKDNIEGLLCFFQKLVSHKGSKAVSSEIKFFKEEIEKQIVSLFVEIIKTKYPQELFEKFDALLIELFKPEEDVCFLFLLEKKLATETGNPNIFSDKPLNFNFLFDRLTHYPNTAFNLLANWSWIPTKGFYIKSESVHFIVDAINTEKKLLLNSLLNKTQEKKNAEIKWNAHTVAGLQKYFFENPDLFEKNIPTVINTIFPQYINNPSIGNFESDEKPHITSFLCEIVKYPCSSLQFRSFLDALKECNPGLYKEYIPILLQRLNQDICQTAGQDLYFYPSDSQKNKDIEEKLNYLLLLYPSVCSECPDKRSFFKDNDYHASSRVLYYILDAINENDGDEQSPNNYLGLLALLPADYFNKLPLQFKITIISFFRRMKLQEPEHFAIPSLKEGRFYVSRLKDIKTFLEFFSESERLGLLSEFSKEHVRFYLYSCVDFLSLFSLNDRFSALMLVDEIAVSADYACYIQYSKEQMSLELDYVIRKILDDQIKLPQNIAELSNEDELIKKLLKRACDTGQFEFIQKVLLSVNETEKDRYGNFILKEVAPLSEAGLKDKYKPPLYSNAVSKIVSDIKVLYIDYLIRDLKNVSSQGVGFWASCKAQLVSMGGLFNKKNTVYTLLDLFDFAEPDKIDVSRLNSLESDGRLGVLLSALQKYFSDMPLGERHSFYAPGFRR